MKWPGMAISVEFLIFMPQELGTRKSLGQFPVFGYGYKILCFQIFTRFLPNTRYFHIWGNKSKLTTIYSRKSLLFKRTP